MTRPKLVLHYLNGHWTMDPAPRGPGFATIQGEAVINIFIEGKVPSWFKPTYPIFKEKYGSRPAE